MSANEKEQHERDIEKRLGEKYPPYDMYSAIKHIYAEGMRDVLANPSRYGLCAVLVAESPTPVTGTEEGAGNGQAIPVKPELYGFHTHDQLFFRRNDNGSVTITKFSNKSVSPLIAWPCICMPLAKLRFL